MLQVINYLRLSRTDSDEISVIEAKQGDNQGDVCQIEIYDNQDIVDLSQFDDILFTANKPDMSSVLFRLSDNKNLIKNGNILSLTFTSALLSMHGTVECELSFYKNDIVKSTYNFNIYVFKSPGSFDELNNSDLSTIKEAVKTVINIGDAAKISAENAKKSEENAKESENNALNSANMAETSANIANEKANEASASATEAKKSEENAKASEIASSNSESNALSSANAAKNSEKNSKDSENKANQSEINAKNSENVANNKAQESKDYALLSQSYAISGTNSRENEDIDNAKYYSTQSKISSNNALNSAQMASTKADESKISADNASDSAQIAIDKASEATANASSALNSANQSAEALEKIKGYSTIIEDNLKSSNEAAKNAKVSENNAKVSEIAANNSASDAHTSEINASTSALNAYNSEQNCASSEANSLRYSQNTKLYEDNASNYASQASISASMASDKADIAINKASEADTSAKNSLEYANKAKEYKDKCLQISQGLEGALIPMGTISFENIPTTDVKTGYMYNISNEFTSDERFKDGIKTYSAGTNIYYTQDGKWDVLMGDLDKYVFKTDFENHKNNKSNPHNVTKEQVGLNNVPNVTTNNQTVTYSDANALTTLSSGEKISIAFGKIKKAISELILHLKDGVKHITSDERTLWNTVKNKADTNHIHGSIDDGANNWTATEIRNHFEGKAEKVHTHTKSDITDFPVSLPANGGTSDYASYLNLVANNEIRFNKNGYSTNEIWLGYVWADGSASPHIHKYIFGNMSGGGLANITANEFIGSIAWGNVSGKPSTYPPATHSHNYIVGQYTGSGGRVPPSYVGANAVKCNMMNGFEGLNTPNLDGYMDVLMMNAYFWNDVPYATALGIKKGNGGVRAWIANGGNTSSWSQVAELLTSANYTEYAADKSHTHSNYLTIKGAQDINNRIATSEGYIADIRDRLSSARLKMTWDGAHLCHYIDGTFIGYMMKTYSDDTFYSVHKVLTFKDSNNVLFNGEKGNYIVGVSVFSDARLKKNVKRSKLNAIECINEIQMCQYDFIDEKYGEHSNLGYIAQQLQKVIPECVVAVPQDKEQMGYDELLQVQDTHLIPYLVKAIQELSSKVAELEKKIDNNTN